MTDLAPWEPDTVCETHEWRASTGETIRFVTRTEAQARMMPPVEISTLRVPQSQGGRFRQARHHERLLTLPVVVPGSQTGRDELRRWARALDPLKGEGTLTVIQGPWAGRRLVCVYEAGLDDFSEEWPHLGLTTLAFRAAYPYWEDSTESTLDAGIDDAVHVWFPFAGSWAAQPLVLGATDLFAVITINNTGDVAAWPIITAVGPGYDLTLTNDTVGASLTFTGYLTSNDRLVIDTRPGHKTVLLGDVNGFGRLTTDSSLWPLAPGPNRVSIGLGSPNQYTSNVTFVWRNAWLSA